MGVTRRILDIDAIFVLACGCTLDGCSGSSPGRAWAEGRRDGLLYCSVHKRWELLVDALALNEFERLPPPPEED